MAAILFLASLAFQTSFITLDAFVSDEGIVLLAADDIANGKLLYKDCNVPLTPAAYLLQGLVFKIFGSSFMVSRALIAITNALGVALVFGLASAYLPRRPAIFAGLLAIPLQIWMWPHAQFFSYNTLTIILCLAAMRLAWSLESGTKRRRDAFYLGIALGAGLWAKPNLPLAVGAGVLLYWLSGWLRNAAGMPATRERGLAVILTEGIAVLAGIAAISLPMLAYLASVGILDDMVRNMIAISQIYDDSPTGLFPGLFPPTAQIDAVRVSPGLVMPGMLINGTKGLAANPTYKYLVANTGWVDLIVRMIYYTPVALYLLTAGYLSRKLIRGSWTREDEAALLALFTGFLLFLTIIPFPAFHYITPTLLPLVGLVTFLAHRAHSASWVSVRRVGALLSFGAVSLYLVISSVALATYLGIDRSPIETPRGTIWVEQSNATLWSEIFEHTRKKLGPDDHIFAVPYFPLFYYLTGREHPSRFVAFGPGLPGRPEEDRLIDQLERDQINFVLYTPGIEYPGLEEFKNAYPRLHHYIETRFEVEREFESPYGTYAFFMERRS